MSYAVAKVTAKSTTQSALISADVEREKLAHAREEFLASRRDKARDHLVALINRMDIVANAEIVTAVRQDAAREAQNHIAAVVITLRDDAHESPLVDELIDALRVKNLERSGEIWSVVRSSIMSGRLP